MAYGETKVYFDGSHYIAIPHTERPKRYRPKPVEEKITVADDNEGSETVKATEPLISPVSDGNDDTEQLLTDTPKSEPQAAIPAPKNERQMTRKELFEELYKKYIDLPRAERHYKVMDGMEPYFDTIEQLKWYVDLGFERKHKNMVYRRIRMVRKARLARFNYFCTFTYSDEKHTEESFKKALQTCLRNLCYRKEWKYMGVTHKPLYDIYASYHEAVSDRRICAYRMLRLVLRLYPKRIFLSRLPFRFCLLPEYSK